MRTDVLLKLILTKQGGAHWGCEGQYSLDCSDHKTVKFKTLRAGGKVSGSSQTWNSEWIQPFQEALEKESHEIRSWGEEGPKKPG